MLISVKLKTPRSVPCIIHYSLILATETLQLNNEERIEEERFEQGLSGP